jgi:hypothetical protein
MLATKSKSPEHLTGINSLLFIWCFLAVFLFIADSVGLWQLKIDRSFLIVASGSIFFNSSHTFLTYFIYMTKECRRSSYLSSTKSLALYLIMMLAVLYFFTSLLVWGKFSSKLLPFALIISGSISLNHALRQSLGLSLQRSGYLKGNRRSEHLSIALLTWCGAGFLAYQIWNLPFLFWMSLVSFFVCIGFLFVMTQISPSVDPSQKTPYLLRYLVISLAPINPKFLFASTFIHGMESAQNYLSMARKKSPLLFGLFFAFLFISIPLSAVFYHPNHINALLGVDFFGNNLVKWLICLSSANNFFHIFLESRLFNFSHPEIRKIIGPFFQR